MNTEWISHIIQRPKTFIVGCLLLTLLTALGAANLYFRGDYRVFFEPDNPQRVAYEKMQAVFTKNESVSIIISVSEGDLFNNKSLTLIKELSDASWQVPLSTRVDSITNFQHSYDDQGDLIVEDLLLELDWLSPERIAKIKRVSLSEPDLINKVISPNGRVAMININILLPDGDQTKEITQVSSFVREMIAPYQEAYPEHRFDLSGIVIMTDAMFLAAIKDATTLFPIMFVLISVMIAVLLRSAWATVATLIIVMVSIASTMGIGGWLGMFINIATVNVPVIIMTLAIADSIHVISSMRFYMLQGHDKTSAISKSLSINTKPIILTSVTTAVGFLTMNFAKVPILADLGNLVAIGVMMACLFSLVMLPSILYVLPIKFAAQTGVKNQQNWQKMADFTIKNSRGILIFSVVLMAASVYLASKNELNDIAIDYFNKGNEFRQSADFQQDNLSGLSTIDFAIYTGIDNQINDPAFLNTVDEFTAWLMQQEEVDHIYSYANVIRRLNRNMNNDDPNFALIPEQKDLAAQYLLFYEMSLPFGLDVNNQINIKKSAVRVMVTLKNLGSKDFTQFEDRAKQWMLENGPNYQMDAASLPLIFAHIGKANMQGMMQGAVVALVLISLLLLFALKSTKLGFISLVPNLMPGLIGFACWALISAEISMALSVVMTMTMGIIVDDTVHFLSKYKKAIDDGLANNEAILFAFNNVGNALLITTLVLASGFAVLAFSDFAINSDMGTLTSIIIVAALVIDLLILPALLATGKHNISKNKVRV